MRSAAQYALCLTLLPGCVAAQTDRAAKPAVFPDVVSYSLDKARVDLPSGFEGKVNLLLLSFEPEQQKDIETWYPAAQALQHTNFAFRWYRLPVEARENFIFRWWDNSSLRSDETDPEMWHWIVPIYVNKDDFRRSLQIPNEHEIAVLLVDKEGHVLWRSSGVMTPQKRAALDALPELQLAAQKPASASH
ncbi:hypothetical protein [Silvibacterium dinghuense]|uniref:Uncharacterized protein n=1 Tax=Silvibacterium dinghuense TaxID=1560006 RepID=A0A4Q1SEB5_9BACT|nr:hypothetical protein [Silvibacterium dinghuense]RXS95604.1 hypothetical protein ESZ00_13660 [Silvibacterium dinghuense]